MTESESSTPRMTLTPSSSLTRIVALLERLQRVGDGWTLLSGWATVIGIPMNGALIPKENVGPSLRSMATLVREWDRVHQSLVASVFEASDYTTAYQRIDVLFSWTHIPQTLANLKSGLADEWLNTLRMCSRVVPKEVAMLNTDDLSQLDEAIEALAEAIAALPAADALRYILQVQLEEMRQARLDYIIAGPEVFARVQMSLEGAMQSYAGPSLSRARAQALTEPQARALSAAGQLLTSVKRIVVASSITLTGLLGSVAAVQKLAPIAAEAEMFYLGNGTHAADLEREARRALGPASTSADDASNPE